MTHISAHAGNYVIGGDCNCILNPMNDRSSGVDNTHQQSKKVFLKSMTDLNLVEIWRYLNPSKKEYSCFSSTYTTFSRIDYFLIYNGLVAKVGKSWYDGILLSDHAPVLFTIQLDNFVLPPPRFRFQASWLFDHDFVKFLDNKLKYYNLL